MGSGASHKTEQTVAIDKEIEAERMVAKNTIKVLMLGAGDSGKSTVVKQLKILHDHGFSDEEKKQQKSIIDRNTVSATINVLAAMKLLEIEFHDLTLEVESKLIRTAFTDTSPDPMKGNISSALLRLWEDIGVQECFGRRSEYEMDDSDEYFFKNLDRFVAKNYVPTEEDILRARLRTTGVYEARFRKGRLTYRVVDVGGQRSERRKWIRCFEDVDAILFVTSLSEYNQVLEEDHSVNRMHDSLALFDRVVNHQLFMKTSMILFLNKRDLFAEKIQHTSIRVAFEDYKGAQTYDEAVIYIRNKFDERRHNPDKNVFIHETCATDTNQVKLILDSVLELISKRNVQGMVI